MKIKPSEKLTPAQQEAVEWVNAVDGRTQRWVRTQQARVKRNREKAIAFLDAKLTAAGDRRASPVRRAKR